VEEHHSQVKLLANLERNLSLMSHTLPISVNGGSNVMVDQPDSGGGNVSKDAMSGVNVWRQQLTLHASSVQTVISVPVKLTLRSGANTLVFGNGQNSAFMSVFTTQGCH
jgi:hypothetical protein